MKTLWKSLILMSLIIIAPFATSGFQANDDIDQKVLALKGQDILPLHQKRLREMRRLSTCLEEPCR